MLLPRFSTHSKRSNHLTEILSSVVTQWLPWSFRIDFKVLLRVQKAFSAPAPAYICNLSTPYETVRC